MKASARQIHRLVVLATSVALLGLAESLPRPSGDLPLRIAVGLWPGSESLLLAREVGLLPESRFTILEATWPSAAYRAFDNGAVDAAILTGEDMGKLLESGKRVKMVCVMDESKGADALVALGEVASVGDLRGKRVGYAPHGPGIHLLNEALARAGLASSEVEAVSLLQPDIPDALFRQEVSAVVASEPWIGLMAARGARVLMDSGEVASPIYRMLVVKEDVLDAQRDALVVLVRSHLAMAPSLFAAESRKNFEAVLRRQRISRRDFAEVMERIRILDRNENLRLMEGGVESMTGLLSLSASGIEPSPWSPIYAEKWWDETILGEAVP